MHNKNELTTVSHPNWSQEKDFPVPSDMIVQ